MGLGTTPSFRLLGDDHEWGKKECQYKACHFRGHLSSPYATQYGHQSILWCTGWGGGGWVAWWPSWVGGGGCWVSSSRANLPLSKIPGTSSSQPWWSPRSLKPLPLQEIKAFLTLFSPLARYLKFFFFNAINLKSVIKKSCTAQLFSATLQPQRGYVC